MSEIVCAHCGTKAQRSSGHVNRSRKLGWPLYCDRKCAGLARRVDRTDAEKKEIKRLYDIEYRRKNFERLRPVRAAYFQKVYAANPEKFRAERQRRMPLHVEYCRQPKYKEKKHRYDRERYGKTKFGEFWESHVLAMDIVDECRKRESAYESRLKNGTLNKALNRSRNGQTKRSYA